MSNALPLRARLRWHRQRLAVDWRSSGTVRERIAFFGREVFRRRCTRVYRLRRSDLRAVIRHPMIDSWVLHEVFAADEYRVPSQIKERLLALGRRIRVLDLGGNVGLFALYIQKMFPGADVVSFEPDPRNLGVLQRCVQANDRLRWNVVPAAAGTADGEASLISDFGLSQLESVAQQLGGHLSWDRWMPEKAREHHPRPETMTVAVKDVFPYLRECDLVKIDIEGGEWELLRDPRFADTDAVAIVIEAHPLPGREDTSRAALDELFSRTGFVPTRPWVSGAEAEVLWAHRDNGPPA